MTVWGQQVSPTNALPEYPRPQMARANNSWVNLNGLWQFQPGSPYDAPPFGQTLSTVILVPYPAESCLSGIGQTMMYLWYRLIFNAPWSLSSGQTLLHFGAVDWETTVYINGEMVGTHQGGYDSFTFTITPFLEAQGNEILVYVYDPSDEGFQPNGKQRISAMTDPGGDTYTPASGIWQTVWLENVPNEYITSLDIEQNSQTNATVTVYSTILGNPVHIDVYEGNTVVTSADGVTGSPLILYPSNPKIWDPPTFPFLYNMTIKLQSGDVVNSYFGLRTFVLINVQWPGKAPTGPQVGIDRPGDDLPNMPVTLASADPNLCWQMCNNTAGCQAWAYAIPNCQGGYPQPMCWLKNGQPAPTANSCRISGAQAIPGGTVKRPAFNGKQLMLAGWLDQSYWPDGIYTAPTDQALAFDLQAVSMFGLNLVRLHQKANPERWYMYADQLGVIVFQDMIQKYGGATSATVDPFMNDLRALIVGKKNHPCIVQWTAFNEDDCWEEFDVVSVVNMIESMDPTRPVDTDSGGGANNLYYGDVNDIHTYPYPGDPLPDPTQYAMVGEYGGVGAFVPGHEWVPGGCYAYLEVSTPTDEANTYINMTQSIYSNEVDISACVYTQITDVEEECDGFFNYDRTNKFSSQDTQRIYQANQFLIYG